LYLAALKGHGFKAGRGYFRFFNSDGYFAVRRRIS
jgi:hypothetical protein